MVTKKTPTVSGALRSGCRRQPGHPVLPPSGVPSSPPGTDKVVHVGLFAALFVTGVAARIPWRALAPALVLYAAISEVIQSALGRSADLTDVIADVAGIVLGALIAIGGMRRRR